MVLARLGVGSIGCSGRRGWMGGLSGFTRWFLSVWFFYSSFDILDSFIISLHVLLPAESKGYCDFPSASLTNVIVARGRIRSPMVRTYIGVYGFTSDITVFCLH